MVAGFLRHQASRCLVAAVGRHAQAVQGWCWPRQAAAAAFLPASSARALAAGAQPQASHTPGLYPAPPQDWEWSPNPADNTFVAYQAEQGNLPARVALVHLPGREELRQKNLFSVAGACRIPPLGGASA